MNLFFKKRGGESNSKIEKEGKNEQNNETEEASKNERSKTDAQAELFEKFGLRKTADFQKALQAGELEKAEEWLKYIRENKLSFPQYLATWDNWLRDREEELAALKK